MCDHTFSAIADFYKSQVEEIDKAGFGDVLKECAEAFFHAVNCECPVHFEDITFLDGYFIFGSGTNSVVHFHIKECPGWLFAIWWNIPDEKKEDVRFITGTFFTQFEESIDKFKPSRSEIQADVGVPLADPTSASVWEATRLIKFIIDEPYLAFCRHELGWNYNEEYHTREEAEEEWNKFRAYEDGKAEITKICDDKMLAFVKEKILPMFTGGELVDLGEEWSPRYEVRAPFDLNSDIAEDRDGFYSWFDEGSSGKALEDEWNALRAECKEIAKDYWWFPPVSPNVWLYRTESTMSPEESTGGA